MAFPTVDITASAVLFGSVTAFAIPRKKGTLLMSIASAATKLFAMDAPSMFPGMTMFGLTCGCAGTSVRGSTHPAGVSRFVPLTRAAWLPYPGPRATSSAFVDALCGGTPPPGLTVRGSGSGVETAAFPVGDPGVTRGV